MSYDPSPWPNMLFSVFHPPQVDKSLHHFRQTGFIDRQFIALVPGFSHCFEGLSMWNDVWHSQTQMIYSKLM